MADKVLNTRIQLKNADLQSWNSSTLKLLAGEVALARVLTTQVADNGDTVQVPTYLMKVGDGDKTFAQLNWLAAPASDVHTWAKKALMDYEDLPQTLKDEIDALQASIGEGGSVATQIEAAISAAIEELKVTDTAVTGEFVTAVSESDGKISVTRRALTAADIPTLAIDKIDGLQDALDAKASKSAFDTLNDVVTKADTGLVAKLAKETADRSSGDEALGQRIDTITNTTIPGLETRIGANATAAQNAQNAADAAQNDVNDLEGVVNTLTQTVSNNKTAAETLVSTEAATRQTEDEKLAKAIEDLEAAIGNVTNVMNFRGAVASVPEADATGSDGNPYDEGDVIVVTSGDDQGKEFVYSNGAWIEFGNIDAQQTAIVDLQNRMKTAEEDIDSLQLNSATKGELAAEKSALQEAINLKADNSALTATNNRVTTLENAVTKSGALVDRVGALETTVNNETTGLVKKVADLESASATHATKTELQAVESTASEAVGNEKTRAENAEKALGERIDGAVSEHNKLAARVTTAEGTLTKHGTRIGELETASATHAKQSDLTAATNRISDIETNYVKVDEANQLVTQSGDVIIFNCGGAN